MRRDIITKAIKWGLLKPQGIATEELSEILTEIENMGYVVEKVRSTGNYLIDEDEFVDDYE